MVVVLYSIMWMASFSIRVLYYYHACIISYQIIIIIIISILIIYIVPWKYKDVMINKIIKSFKLQLAIKTPPLIVRACFKRIPIPAGLELGAFG